MGDDGMWDLVSFWSCLGRENSEFDMPMKENWVEEKYMKSIIAREREGITKNGKGGLLQRSYIVYNDHIHIKFFYGFYPERERERERTEKKEFALDPSPRGI